MSQSTSFFFTSNFIGLVSLRDSSYADIASASHADQDSAPSAVR